MPPVKHHEINPDTTNAAIENTINSTPPTMFLVANGACGTSMHTPNHMNMANVANPVAAPVT